MRPTKSKYSNPFERIDHQFEDVGWTKNSMLVEGLGNHRKEEKDNGKRIDALTRALPWECKSPSPRKRRSRTSVRTSGLNPRAAFFRRTPAAM